MWSAPAWTALWLPGSSRSRAWSVERGAAKAGAVLPHSKGQSPNPGSQPEKFPGQYWGKLPEGDLCLTTTELSYVQAEPGHAVWGSAAPGGCVPRQSLGTRSAR